MRNAMPLLIASMLLQGCQHTAVKPNPFPQPPPSLVALTDKPTLLEDWQILKVEFLRSLNAGTGR